MSRVKYSKLSSCKIKKVVRHFCADIEASKTALQYVVYPNLTE